MSLYCDVCICGRDAVIDSLKVKGWVIPAFSYYGTDSPS